MSTSILKTVTASTESHSSSKKQMVFQSLVKTYCKIAEYGAIASLIGMITAITIQVIARIIFPSAPNWTEELARIFFIYLIGFGVANGLKENAFVKLEILSNYLSFRAQKILNLFIYNVIALFSLAMLYYSFLFVKLGTEEKSAALVISMGFVFFGILFLMLSICILSFHKIKELLLNQNKEI